MSMEDTHYEKFRNGRMLETHKTETERSQISICYVNLAVVVEHSEATSWARITKHHYITHDAGDGLL